jgi:hypothetical protein
LRVFKRKVDGMLYVIHVIEKDGVNLYTAVPYRHSSCAVKGVSLEDFTIHSSVPGAPNMGFI